MYHHNIYSPPSLVICYTPKKSNRRVATGRCYKMMNQKQVRQTRTFQLQKTPPIQEPQYFTAPNDQYSSTATFVPKKSPPPVEFPTSPQLIFGQEIIHFTHPRHPLSMVDIPDLFTCTGCKEYGSGKRFVCQQCEFQLHDFCAFAPPALKAHPLHSQHSVLFHSKPGDYSIYISL